MNTEQNYKNSPLGLIPNDWEVKELKDLGVFSKGKGILKDEVKKEGFPCIRYGEIYTTYNYVVKNFQSFINEETAKTSQKVKRNDILFAGSGETIDEIGKSVALLEDIVAYAGGDIIIFSPKESINAECLVYLLESENSLKQKRVMGQGNAVVHIYSSELSKLKIPLPPLPEQKAIAKVLGTWDEAISKMQALITQKELQKKYLMQNLLTGKKRLKGFVNEWKEYKLGYFIDEYQEKPNTEMFYEVLTSSKEGLMRQLEYYGNNRITNRDNVDYNVIPPNYITYRSRSDDGLFTFNKNNFNITGLVSGYYPVFTIKNGNINFILSYLNFFNHRLKKFSIGTSQLVLSVNALKSASFKLPEEKEQTAIAKILEASNKEISLLKQQLDSLKTQKKGIMQQLLTGKKRLKVKE